MAGTEPSAVNDALLLSIDYQSLANTGRKNESPFAQYFQDVSDMWLEVAEVLGKADRTSHD